MIFEIRKIGLSEYSIKKHKRESVEVKFYELVLNYISLGLAPTHKYNPVLCSSPECSVGDHGDGGEGGNSGGDHLGGVGIGILSSGNGVFKSNTSTPSPGGVDHTVGSGGGGSDVTSWISGGLLEPGAGKGCCNCGNGLDSFGIIGGFYGFDTFDLRLDGGVEAPVEGGVISGTFDSSSSRGSAGGDIGGISNGCGGPGIISSWVYAVEVFLLSGNSGNEGGESVRFHIE
jgi:hypothetical protein